MKIKSPYFALLGLLGIAIVLSGCHTDMYRQPKAIAQETTDFWPDGQVERPRIAGTVAWGELKTDRHKFTGRVGNKLSPNLPASLVINGETLSTSSDLRKILERGRERYSIFCSHCHGVLGDGKGMIAQRGLALRRSPATYHTDRLRKMQIGHFFDVVTNGFGAMFPFKGRVEADDRWAIAAYIRVLQETQMGTIDNIPAEERAKLESGATETTGEAGGH